MSVHDTKQALLRMSHHNTSSDASSLRSFASSSSTLFSSPISPVEEKFNSEIHEHEPSSPILRSQFWRKTPLSPHGLSTLLSRVVVASLLALVPSFLRRRKQRKESSTQLPTSMPPRHRIAHRSHRLLRHPLVRIPQIRL